MKWGHKKTPEAIAARGERLKKQSDKSEVRVGKTNLKVAKYQHKLQKFQAKAGFEYSDKELKRARQLSKRLSRANRKNIRATRSAVSIKKKIYANTKLAEKVKKRMSEIEPAVVNLGKSVIDGMKGE